MEEGDQIRDLLLKEYAEAGQLSRQHEQLTRTSASLFVPTLLALAGYVLASGTPMHVKFILAIAGLLVSLLAVNITRRHQLYYRTYIRRARAIEVELKVGDRQIIHLYTSAQAVKKDARTISSKNAFIVFFLSSALMFAVSSSIFGYCFIRAIAP